MTRPTLRVPAERNIVILRARPQGPRFLAILFALAVAMASTMTVASEPIKVGILHSLTGTMAISEAPLKDLLLMLIRDQNRAGGLLGRKLEPIVADPRSDAATYASKARELLINEKVDVVFGGWTSVARKAVLPVFEELDGLLFYPVQYEAEESSKNIFYFGATPNQQAIPAVDFLMSEQGGSIRRWVLLGTDYIYPRTANRILRAYLQFEGVSDFDIMERYTPFAHADWKDIVSEIRRFGSAGLNTAVISTINGDANVHFYDELSRQRISAQQIPVMAFSVGEVELTSLGSRRLAGHFAAWNYFMSIDTLANRNFVSRWRKYSGNPKAVLNDPIEAHYIGFKMWTQAVTGAGTADVIAVRRAMYGQRVRNLSDNYTVMNTNHHLSKPVYIGKVRADGNFDIVWSSEGLIKGDAWSDYILESAKLTSDWTYPWVCGKCERPTFGAAAEY